MAEPAAPAAPPTNEPAKPPTVDADDGEDLFGSDSDSDENESTTIPASGSNGAPDAAAAAAAAPAAKAAGKEGDDDSDADLFGSDSDDDLDDGQGDATAASAATEGAGMGQSGQARPGRHAEGGAELATQILNLPPYTKITDGEISLIQESKLVGIQFKEFDPATFDAEEDRQWNTDEDGNVKHINVVRWRYKRDGDNNFVLDDKGERVVESNAKFVTWSDGTKTLQVGAEVLIVDFKPLERGTNFLYREVQHTPADGGPQEPVLECAGPGIAGRWSFRPSGLNTKSHKALLKLQQARRAKNQRSKLKKSVTKVDPEREAMEKARAIQEQLNADARRRKKESQNNGPSTRRGGMDSRYLEESDEEDRADRSYGESESDDEFDADLEARKRAEKEKLIQAREERLAKRQAAMGRASAAEGPKKDSNDSSSNSASSSGESGKKRKADEVVVDEDAPGPSGGGGGDEDDEDDAGVVFQVKKKAKTNKFALDDDDDDDD
jgi:RNA polymerase-associated protein LEO1